MKIENKIVLCEQLNVNDNSYKLIELRFKNGDVVKKGDIVLSLDSSKASYDVPTDFDGIFYTLHNINDNVGANKPLFLVLENYDLNELVNYNAAFELDNEINNESNKGISSENKIITEKAKKLIAEHNLNIDIFNESLITKEIVNNYLQNGKKPSKIILENPNYNLRKRVAVIGGGKGFIQLLDIISACNIIPVFIYDDDTEKLGQNFYNVLVKDKVDYDIIKKDFENNLFDFAVIAISTSISFRKRIFKDLIDIGIPFCNLIHPTAYIGFHCILGNGNIILPFVSVGPCTEIGDNNFISAHSNIEHHNNLGSHCTFGPGVLTSGTVTIGNEVKFGTGVFVEPRLSIGKNSIISSGSVITKNVPSDTIVFSKHNELNFKAINK